MHYSLVSSSTMNPYATEQDEIPQTDKYLDVPLYGRYCPKPDDFRVDRQHINSQSTDSLQYWASVVELCDESIRIYPASEGGRDVFAVGSVIIKSSHLRTESDAQYPEIDYSYADSNELQAISIAKSALKDVRVPEIYFAGKVLTSCLVSFQSLMTNDIPDSWSSGAGPGKAPGCYIGCRMAVSLSRSKGIFQKAGQGHSSAYAGNQASR